MVILTEVNDMISGESIHVDDTLEHEGLEVLKRFYNLKQTRRIVPSRKNSASRQVLLVTIASLSEQMCKLICRNLHS